MEEFMIMLEAIISEKGYAYFCNEDEEGEVTSLQFKYEGIDKDRHVQIIALNDSILIRTLVIEEFGDSPEKLEFVNDLNAYHIEYRFVIDEDGDLMIERWCSALAEEDVNKYSRAYLAVINGEKMCKLSAKLENLL